MVRHRRASSQAGFADTSSSSTSDSGNENNQRKQSPIRNLNTAKVKLPRKTPGEGSQTHSPSKRPQQKIPEKVRQEILKRKSEKKVRETEIIQNSLQKPSREKSHDVTQKSPQKRHREKSHDLTQKSPKKVPKDNLTKTQKTNRKTASGKGTPSKEKGSKMYRPYGKALLEIRHYQRTTDLLLLKAPFARLVREITQSMVRDDIRYRREALEALQTAAEFYITGLFEDSYLLTLHRGRVTLSVKDVLLTQRIRGYGHGR